VKLAGLLLAVILGTPGVAYAQAAPKDDCGGSGAPSEFTYDGLANRPWYPPLTANPFGVKAGATNQAFLS